MTTPFKKFPLALLLLAAAPAVAAASEYPIMDKAADKVIAKYQGSSCAELQAKKEKPAPAGEAQEEKKVATMLKNDPAMRQQFIGKVASPIANKLFECGMLP
ncbi:hypothetical protein ACLESD_17200 [Pyxidicoccus sp. 3LFB2]